MAWSTPLTAVANAALTAAQWNASVRDNLNATAAALATAAGQYFVATGANTLAARMPSGASDPSTGTTTSTSFTSSLTGAAGSGPAVTVTTGVRAVVAISTVIGNGTGNAETACSYAVSGASSIAASDPSAIRFTPFTADSRGRHGIVDWLAGLTAGSNTFTMQYKASSGTASFDDRTIVVLPF